MTATLLLLSLLAAPLAAHEAAPDGSRSKTKSGENAAKQKLAPASDDDDEDEDGASPAVNPPVAKPASKAATASVDPPRFALDPPPQDPDEASLLAVHRVYVDRLTGGATAAQLRDLIISALQGTKLFVLTENEQRADAVLRGAAEDLMFTDKFSSSEGLSARGNSSDSSNSSGTSGLAHYGSGRSRSMGAGISDNDSVHIEERKHEAMATVRLVNRDGDVLWSTTQESLGGKFKGASADVADKIARQLAADIERTRRVRRLP
jgi:hypothetical protein